MKKFFVILLASVLGTLLALFLLIVILVGAASSMGETTVEVKPNSILHIELNGPIVERSTNNPFESLAGNFTGNIAPVGLNDVLASIQKASRDTNIVGIYLQSGLMSAGYATLEEIRNALLQFKASGKFIYSYAPVYTQKAYYLASVADKVYLTPMGMLEFSGIHSERMFYKGLLEKIGVEMQIVRHGQYKSAVEPYMLDQMSDASRLQTTVYVQSIWNHNLSRMAQSRQVPVEKLNALASRAPMFNEPRLMVEEGLIDAFKYTDEVIAELKEKTGIAQSDDLNAISIQKYKKVYVAGTSKGLEKNKIAIVYAEGEIDGASGGIDSEALSKAIRQARRDSTIKAIVLRINSPGGSALGSEIIWREVKLAKEAKPTVVSMGDLAASGGYYIACAADSILAHPNTLTGSIGIFGMIPNSAGLMKKIGLTFDGVKTNEFADLPSLTRPFTPAERNLMQQYIERGYQTFIQRCADGRATTTSAIDSIGQGRVWSGANAIENKLIDKIGGIADALKVAQNMAGLEAYRVVELPEQKDPIAEFLEGIQSEGKASFLRWMVGEEAKYLQTIEQLRQGYPVQARMPFDIQMN